MPYLVILVLYLAWIGGFLITAKKKKRKTPNEKIKNVPSQQHLRHTGAQPAPDTSGGIQGGIKAGGGGLDSHAPKLPTNDS